MDKRLETPDQAAPLTPADIRAILIGDIPANLA